MKVHTTSGSCLRRILVSAGRLRGSYRPRGMPSDSTVIPSEESSSPKSSRSMIVTIRTNHPRFLRPRASLTSCVSAPPLNRLVHTKVMDVLVPSLIDGNLAPADRPGVAWSRGVNLVRSANGDACKGEPQRQPVHEVIGRRGRQVGTKQEPDNPYAPYSQYVLYACSSR